MRTKNKFLILSLFVSNTILSQQIVDVTEQTIKVGPMKTEEMYFGFAEGDQIIFNFTEADKKDLKEVEIIEYPSNSKFSDYKIDRIENKTLNVSRTAIYKFRFYNSSITGRVCKIKVQRIPSSEATKHYNTTVSWVNKQDTSWHSFTNDVIVGYDTTYEQNSRKELVKTEQREELIFDKTQRVHSNTNENGNKTSIFFSLPKNQFSNNTASAVVSWAYWIGVNDEAAQAWRQNVQAMGKLVKGAASYFTSPLGALAIGAVADLAVPKMGEDVSYGLTDAANRSLFHAGQQFRGYDFGKGVVGYKKFTDKALCQGTYFFCLSNDNIVQGIDATVKVIAIVETKYFEDKVYNEQKVSPRYEKQTIKEPVIRTVIIPIAG
jgi:hypothetical protein